MTPAPVRLFSGAFLVIAASAITARAEDTIEWPHPPAAIESVVSAALEANLSLQSSWTEVERAQARLDAARSNYYPRLDLVARYSRAEGGRTIDFPAGDLLNPVYRTLNSLTASNSFQPIPNVSINLLRTREQETRLRLLQPLYQPEIAAGTRAARAQLAATRAGFSALRRDLRLQTQEAWLALRQARAAVHILEAAQTLVDESLRVNRALRENDKVTDDVVLRAEAESALVREQLASARRDASLAAAYLNTILDRPLDSPPPEVATGDLAAYRATLVSISVPLEELTIDAREELIALQNADEAAHAARSAAASRELPQVGLAVEAGTQGESYRTGPGYNYAMGSVVAEWNLFDGRERRSAVAAAEAGERAARLRLRDAKNQLALQLQQAREEFSVAQLSLTAAGQRVTAARAAYAVVAARQREGAAAQLTVLDARTTLTDAELSAEMAATRLFSAAARVDRAAALIPLP